MNRWLGRSRVQIIDRIGALQQPTDRMSQRVAVVGFMQDYKIRKSNNRIFILSFQQ